LDSCKVVRNPFRDLYDLLQRRSGETPIQSIDDERYPLTTRIRNQSPSEFIDDSAFSRVFFRDRWFSHEFEDFVAWRDIAQREAIRLLRWCEYRNSRLSNMDEREDCNQLLEEIRNGDHVTEAMRERNLVPSH